MLTNDNNYILPFRLEQYFAKYEFCTKYLLCCSDCESITMNELLSMADSDSLSLWDNLTLGYTEPTGLLQLKDEILKHLFHYNNYNITFNNDVITNNMILKDNNINNTSDMITKKISCVLLVLKKQFIVPSKQF